MKQPPVWEILSHILCYPLDRLKSEIDAIGEEKREAVSTFRAHESEYKRFLYERREENRAKRREEREEREAEKIREL